MNDQNGPPQAMEPSPQPTNWGFDHTTDGSHVVLIKQTPGGTSVDFVTPEAAFEFAKQVTLQAKLCFKVQQGVDLIIPDKVVLGPDGEPIRVVPPSDEVIEEMQRIADIGAEQAAVDEVMEGVDLTPEGIIEGRAQEPDSDG